MENKKELETKETIRVVTANNFISACGLENISLKARKLLYLAISQCRKNDKDFYEYEIAIRDFAKIMNIKPTHVYQEADKITDELMKGFIKFIPEGEKSFKKFTLFSMCEYIEKIGTIHFKLNQEMTPILLELQKDFSQPLLNDFVRMNSNYSIEVWHLMQREMHSKKPTASKPIEFYLSLEEIRKVTGTQNKFSKISDIRRFVLDKAIREIKDNCSVIIDYEDVKRARTIVGFSFTAKSEIKEPSKKKKLEVETKKAIFELSDKSKVRELTKEEKAEYNRAIKDAKQIGLDEWLSEFIK